MAFLSSDLCDSLTDEHIDCLNGADVWTVNDLAAADLMELRRTTGLKYHVLKEAYDKARLRYTLPCIELNFLLEKSIQECKVCPTGLPELTQALDGGFQTQEIVELFGDSECGKTELCYLLCGEILSHYDNYHILFVTSNSDLEPHKIANYTRCKAGNRHLKDSDIFRCLERVEIARPQKLADLVHLLNTLIHNDKRNATRCIIIDSLSFIIQDDILDIKTANLNDSEVLERFSGFKTKLLAHCEPGGSAESLRRELIDSYLHEVMRLLTSIAINKNVILVLTNSDVQLTFSKCWTNAIDHRLHLTRMSEASRYSVENPQSIVCRATILKTIHNVSNVGVSIPFAINQDGIQSLRLHPSPPTTGTGPHHHLTQEDNGSPPHPFGQETGAAG